VNEVANQAATCQAYQSKYGSVSLDNMMVFSKPTRCAMALILVSQLTIYSMVIQNAFEL